MAANLYHQTEIVSLPVREHIHRTVGTDLPGGPPDEGGRNESTYRTTVLVLTVASFRNQAKYYYSGAASVPCHCGGENKPAWRMTDSMSQTLHSSQIVPAFKRNMVMPSILIFLPVAGNPIPDWVLVPDAVQYTATRSRSARIWFTLTLRSGKALRSSLAAAMSSSKVAS